MEYLEKHALIIIRRALAFAGLGLGTLMFGFSYDLFLALKVGACIGLLITFVLAWKGLNAPSRNIKSTELWLMLDGELGMPLEQAQEKVGKMLRKLYYQHAHYTFFLSMGFWGFSLVT